MDRAPSKYFINKLFESQPLLDKHSPILDGVPTAPPPSPCSEMLTLGGSVSRSAEDIYAIEVDCSQDLDSSSVISLPSLEGISSADSLNSGLRTNSSCNTLFYPCENMIWPGIQNDLPQPEGLRQQVANNNVDPRTLFSSIAALAGFLVSSFLICLIYIMPKEKSC